MREKGRDANRSSGKKDAVCRPMREEEIKSDASGIDVTSKHGNIPKRTRAEHTRTVHDCDGRRDRSRRPSGGVSPGMGYEGEIVPHPTSPPRDESKRDGHSL